MNMINSNLMKSKLLTPLCLIIVALIASHSWSARAEVQPGDDITKANADKVVGLVSPGNMYLVKQGMRMHIVPAGRIEWPPPYKNATEKYSSQVSVAPNGDLKNFVAGQPFPLLDPNDPQLAQKIMWNYSYRPMYTDDIDMRYPEVVTNQLRSSRDIGYFTVGHFAFYNNIGRIEVPPVPTDLEGAKQGIRYRFGFYPFLEPSGLRGYGLIRYRQIDPRQEDNTWVFNPETRRVRRESPSLLSDAIAALPGFAISAGGGGPYGGGGGGSGGGGGQPFVNNIDPDSYFGFSAKIEDFNYKFLGDREMLASVHARTSPAVTCTDDGGRTICPEDWEKRHIYVVQADAKPGTDLSIIRRILYIDSEGWFITASDQYDRNGELWKTLVAWHTYRDRPVPDARIAIYPYKRIFQIGLADEDLQNGSSSIVYMPGPHSPERECWYIDMGVVDKQFFMPQALENAGH
jgi:hypothetical protein